MPEQRPDLQPLRALVDDARHQLRRVGVAYSQTIQASGTPAPTASLASGTLPTGLTLTGSTRRIAGTPTGPVKADFEITATNSAGSDTKALSILVPNEGSGAAMPAVTTVTLVPAAIEVLPGEVIDLLVTVEGPLDEPIVNLGGTAEVSNANATAEQLAPTDTSGQATIRVTGVTSGECVVSVDFDGVDSNACYVTVLEAVAPTVETTSLPEAITGAAYSQTLEATGSLPIDWALDSGSLPDGLALSEAGAITGIATTAQTANFVVRATNEFGSDTQALSITARLAVGITSVTVTPETVTIRPGAQTQLQAAVDGVGAFNPAVTWSVQSGGGAVSPTGLYTAPADETSAVVRAASAQDPTKYDEATITVEAPPAADAIHVPGIRFAKYAGSTLTVRTRITVLEGSPEGLIVAATSDDASKVAITPAQIVADEDGYTSFVLTFLAGGEAIITFASGELESRLLAISRTG